jgi:hypothetical protein
MISVFGSKTLRIVAGAAVATPLCGAVAHADPAYGIDVSSRIQYSTNPYLSSATPTSAASIGLTAAPYVEINSARSQFRAVATISHTEYSRIYTGATDYGAQFKYRNAISPRLSLHAAAAFDSRRSGSYRPDAISTSGEPSPLPDPTDITRLGAQDRFVVWRGSTGVSYSPDTRNSFSLDYTGLVTRYPDKPVIAGVRQGEYGSIAQDFGYNRVINASLTVGAMMRVNRIDYYRTALGDTTVLSPNINATIRLSSRWTVSGGVGISLLRQTTVLGREKSQDLSTNFNLCRTDSRDTFCLGGSRSVAPSSLGSARKTTSVGATYDYRLNARNTLTFSGNFGRSEQSFLGPLGTANYYSGAMGLKRQVSNRLAIGLDGGFSRSEYSGGRSDAHVGIGIFYHLDNRQ